MPQIQTRTFRQKDLASLDAIMCRQMAAEPGWPPEYARSQNLAEWLGASASIGRWVAVDNEDLVLGHVGCAPVTAGVKAKIWGDALNCPPDKMALVCRLVVDPPLRRAGISALLTRKAVREAIESGYVPVANILIDRSSSLGMMASAGWTSVGENTVQKTGLTSTLMIPPQKLIDIAFSR